MQAEAHRQQQEAAETQRQQQQEAHRQHQEAQQRQAEAIQQHNQAFAEAQARHQQQQQNNHLQQQQQQQIQFHTKGRMPRAKADAKPKGRMTAYAFFVQTCREEHKKKHPEENVVFTEFTKKCAERWKVRKRVLFVY